MNRIVMIFSSIRARIIILAALGVLGMVIIVAVNWRLNNDRRISQENVLLVQKASSQIQTLEGLENNFISSRDQTLFNAIEKTQQDLDTTISKAESLSNNKQIKDILSKLRSSIDERNSIFPLTAQTLLNMDQARSDMTNALNQFNEALLEIVQAINQEEMELSFMGEFVSQLKDSVRKEVKELLGYGNETRLNMMENLLYLGDNDKYSTERTALDERLKLVMENVRLSVRAENSDKYNKSWNKACQILPKTLTCEKNVFELWRTSRDLTAKLNGLTGRVQGLSLDFVSAVTGNAREQDKKGSIINACTAALGLLLLITLGAAIYRAISRPLARTMDLAGAVEKGDLSLRLNLKNENELGQLAGALDKMADRLMAKAELAEEIASGNLTREVELASEKDFLGRSLLKMRESLNEILLQVSNSVGLVDSGAYQVSDSSQALSQGATEQASALEEITSSLMELGSQTKSNAENSAQANRLSVNARDMAEQGVSQMSEMTAAMSEINQASKEIAKIIKTIDDIAFQTNLLALNAAVEAARAGKHGKGFAVVAQEVRNLAGRSAKAAGETEALIAKSVKKAEDGVKVVTTASEAFNQIAGEVARITDLIGEIAAAGSEQAQGLSQINQGLKQVEEVTHKTTAGAEQTAAAAEELSKQSNSLSRLLSNFKLKQSDDEDLEEAGPLEFKSLPNPQVERNQGWETDYRKMIPLDQESDD